MNGHFGELFAIEFDPNQLQSIHKPAVIHSVGPAHGIDAHDPKGTPSAFLIPAVPVSVLQTVVDRLVGVAKKAGAVAPITFSLFDNPLATFAGCGCVSCSRHVFKFPLGLDPSGRLLCIRLNSPLMLEVRARSVAWPCAQWKHS